MRRSCLSRILCTLFGSCFWLVQTPIRAGAQVPALSREDRAYLEALARDTYQCIRFYVSPRTGLPLDNTRHRENAVTSPTNIGFYMASVAAAVELGLESRPEALRRLAAVLKNLRQAPHWNKFIFNWIYIDTLQPQNRFVSSVDLGNYYAGLIVVRQAFPELKAACDDLLKGDWQKLYDPDAKLLYGGYDAAQETYTPWHYKALGHESRLATVVAMAMAGLPPDTWEALDRTLEERHGIQYLKGWQEGGLFLAFLPALFLDETGTLMGLSAGNFALAQRLHQEKIEAPAWGWSASASPDHGYLGFNALRDDVVTPHASVLAVSLFPSEVIENLRALEALGARPQHPVDGMHHDFGFRDAYNTESRRVTPEYLILDQTMLFLSLANYLGHGAVQRRFASYPPVRKVLGQLKDFNQRMPRESIAYPFPLKSAFKLKTVPLDVPRPEVRAVRARRSPLSQPREWHKAEPVDLDTRHMDFGEVLNPEDLSARFSVLWDWRYLYVQCDVTDQSVQNTHTGPDIHKADIVEIFINPDNQGLVWSNAKDVQMGVTPPNSDNGHSAYAWFQKWAPRKNEARTVSEWTETGYRVSAAISWSFLGVREPHSGDAIGLSVAVHDVDDDGSPSAKINWHFKPKEGKNILGKVLLD
jgi:hypothetical protein